MGELTGKLLLQHEVTVRANGVNDTCKSAAGDARHTGAGPARVCIHGLKVQFWRWRSTPAPSCRYSPTIFWPSGPKCAKRTALRNADYG